MLDKLGELMDGHFQHENQIVEQSLYPFVNKIAEAEKVMMIN